MNFIDNAKYAKSITNNNVSPIFLKIFMLLKELPIVNVSFMFMINCVYFLIQK